MLTKVYIALKMTKCHLFRENFSEYSTGHIPLPLSLFFIFIHSLPCYLGLYLQAGWSLSLSPLDRELPEEQGPTPGAPQVFNVLDERVDEWKDG